MVVARWWMFVDICSRKNKQTSCDFGWLRKKTFQNSKRGNLKVKHHSSYPRHGLVSVAARADLH